MEKQKRYDTAYMKMALEWGKLSHCKRKQVGALIVKNRMIISDGYNGTPSGFDNCCEDENDNTYWYVLHAEANAILKIASSMISSPRKQTDLVTLSKLLLRKHSSLSGCEDVTEGGIACRQVLWIEVSLARGPSRLLSSPLFAFKRCFLAKGILFTSVVLASCLAKE